MGWLLRAEKLPGDRGTAEKTYREDVQRRISGGEREDLQLRVARACLQGKRKCRSLWRARQEAETG